MVERGFAKFGKYLIKARYFILLFWVVLAIVMHFAAPSMSDVGTTDESSFLPAGSESTQVRHLLTGSTRRRRTSRVGGNRLLPPGRAKRTRHGIRAAGRRLADVGPEAGARLRRHVHLYQTGQEDQPYQRRWHRAPHASQFQRGFFLQTVGGDIAGIRDYLAESARGLEAYSSGSASISTDLLKTVDKSVSQTTVATVILVLVLLLLIYRSPVAPLVR